MSNEQRIDDKLCEMLGVQKPYVFAYTDKETKQLVVSTSDNPKFLGFVMRCIIKQIPESKEHLFEFLKKDSQ